MIESLLIRQNGKFNTYDNNPVDKYEVQHLSDLSERARKLLLQLSADGILALKEDARKQFRIKKAGVSFQAYAHNALLRRLHELMQLLKPHLHAVKCYHKKETEKGRFRILPCSFSNDRPELHFEVTGTGNSLSVRTLIQVNETVYPLDDFTRFQFMIERENHYFVLSWKDYQTLTWLAEQDPSSFDNDPSAFTTHLLARLETDYRIDRKGLLSKEEIDVLPHPRVMLSEISGSFIVFTP